MAAVLARRFRVVLNTVKNWVRAAENEGRRAAKPPGHGPNRRRVTAWLDVRERSIPVNPSSSR